MFGGGFYICAKNHDFVGEEKSKLSKKTTFQNNFTNFLTQITHVLIM